MTFKPTQIAVHHTVTSEYATPLQINEMHKARGFSGIGYHALVYRARGGDVVVGDGRDDQQIGAHVKGANSCTLGVALSGNYEHKEPDAAQYAHIVGQCVAWCMTHDIKPRYIYGHRDTPGFSGATVCPGMIDVRRIRRMTRAAIAQAE